MRCKRLDETDDTMRIDDVDHECTVGEGGAQFIVWVGSNADRITGFGGAGP